MRVTVDQTLVWCALRYALGRSTYVVEDVGREVERVWDQLPQQTRAFTLRDIREAIEQDRAGMDMDKRYWTGLLARLEAKA